MNNKFKTIALGVFIFLLSLFLFSYKNTLVPAGMTIDEASFGYNAVMLSRTLHDENGRFMPIFVLSIDRNDWRQPITQYYMALFFKLFEPSLASLRFSTALISGVSILLIYVLGGILPAFFLLTTPVFFMHSRLGLDNVMPVVFILTWLLMLLRFTKGKKDPNLIIAGISLGIAFYSYKGFRVFFPIWVITSSLFIYLEKHSFKSVFKYLLSLAPFVLMVPLLEKYYAGAVLNNERIKFESIYVFIERYISSFDLSFLFVRGDQMLFHSTGKHGIYLLLLFPFFIAGLIKSWKVSNWHKFLIVSLLLGPLLFGLFGSLYRASRMISMVPFVVLIATYGYKYLFKKHRIFSLILILLYLLNFVDFSRYYFLEYPALTKNIFYSSTAGLEYEKLKNLSDNLGLKPYVDKTMVPQKFSTTEFYRSISFTTMPSIWDENINSLDNRFVLMTHNPSLIKFKLIQKYSNDIYFYTN